MKSKNLRRQSWIVSCLFLVALGTGISTASIMITIPPEPIRAEGPPDGPPASIDVDGDGSIDFVILLASDTNVIPQSSNRVLSIFEIGSDLAVDLASGSFIGAETQGEEFWSNDVASMVSCASGGGNLVCLGRFVGGDEFLGVEVQRDGATHYGWIGIRSREFSQRVSVLGWAWETDPGVGILAGAIPEPSAAALLLVGIFLVGLRNRPLR